MIDEEADTLSFWSVHELGEGDDRRFQVGPLHLRVRWIAGEVWIAHARNGNERPDPPRTGRPAVDSLEEPEAWGRWSAGGDSARLRFSPVFPDRPLVVQPEHSFHLLRDSKVRIYIRVPLWVRVELLDRKDTVLTEVPTTVLSDTWFGDPTEGELAYYAQTVGRREIGPEHFRPDRIICPLLLSNPSQHDLPVEKIALRVAHLSVYRSDEELWADETQARYQERRREAAPCACPASRPKRPTARSGSPRPGPRWTGASRPAPSPG